jgi:hypothetical protein
MIKVQVSTGWANGDHTDYWELPNGWDEMSEKEQEDFLAECGQDYLFECCEGYADVVEEEGE